MQHRSAFWLFDRALTTAWLSLSIVASMGSAGCKQNQTDNSIIHSRPAPHASFPIEADSVHALGRSIHEGQLACESCHAATSDTFKDFTCTGCHGHERTVTDALHLGQADYRYESNACLACHPAGAKVPFSHTGIENGCATCHAEGA